MIGDGNVDVELKGFQDADFHGKHLFSRIKVFTDIQKLTHRRWAGLLWMERRGSHNQADSFLLSAY
jgi:hypothetical protein